MAQRIPGAPPQAPYVEMPKPSLVRQILATPWLTLVLIGSSLFLLAMMAFTVWGDRGLQAMWRTQRDLERLVREIRLLSKKMPLSSARHSVCAAILGTSRKSPARSWGWCALARLSSSLQIKV